MDIIHEVICSVCMKPKVPSRTDPSEHVCPDGHAGKSLRRAAETAVETFEPDPPARPVGRPPGEPATDFAAYLIKRSLRHQDAAEELQISRVFVSHLAVGDKRPSLELAHKIWLWSAGEVTMQSWFNPPL